MLTEEFEKLMKSEYKANSVLYSSIGRWIFKVLLAFFILYSYFHSPEFPYDKPLILVCSVIYVVLSLLLFLYEKYILDEFISEFSFTRKKDD